MAKPFDKLRKKMPPKARTEARKRAQKMLSEMPLFELREALHRSQVELAESMGINQAAVSKMERRTDIYISTLRRYIRALGGELHIQAEFPEGSVTISELGQIERRSTG